MGLVSYIKNLVYNHKLDKAGKLFDEGSLEKSEQLYLSIIDKQPFAAGKLAECYKTLAKDAQYDEVIKYFDKAVEIESKTNSKHDAKSYDNILSDFANVVYDQAKSSFESCSYQKCHALLTSLNKSKCKSDDSIKLDGESQIHLIFNKVEHTKSTDQLFVHLTKEFKSVWPVVKDVSRAKDTANKFCDKLIGEKRYYASTKFLEIILKDKYDAKLLDNAWQIVYFNDIEASVLQINEIVSDYGKAIVLREGISQEVAVSVFDACWKASKDCVFVMDVLNSVKNESLKDAIITHILAKNKSYLTEPDLFREFSKWTYEKLEASRSLQLLEMLHTQGYNIKNYYVAKLRGWISSMTCDQKIVHLDRAQSLFDDSRILDDKFDCATWYLDHNENEKAVAVADSILPEYKQARVVKSQALCNLSHKEKDGDKKVALLEQAKLALGDGTGEEYTKVRNYISSCLVSASEAYYNSNESKKAYDILFGLAKDGYDIALFTIAKNRLEEVRKCTSLDYKVDSAISAINEIRSFDIPGITANVDYLKLWDEYLNCYIDKRATLDHAAAVKDFEKIYKEVGDAGFDAAETKKKQAVVVKQIINRKYLIARELELAGDVEKAGKLYKEINSLEAQKAPTLSALRFIICKLKADKNSDILAHKDNIYSLLRNAASAFKAEKEDVAYRFALVLLKSGEDKEALSVLKEFLPHEDYLRMACEQGAMIKAQARLEDFNKKIDGVLNKTLSSDDAIYFVNHMKEDSEVIAPILSIPIKTLRDYRGKLKNYAIFKLFDEGNFAIAFEKMTKEHKDYLDDLTALRNIALVCLNMAEAKQITGTNYKEVIAVWLTAIYQERLFIKSLDYTSWDDQFTFSLDEAYGHFNEDTVGDLPDNVNFDYEDFDGKLVFIKDVQRALLDRFEAAISENQQYHEFYTYQKDAMDAFIALNLDVKCRLVAPYLAKKDDTVYEEICDALEQDREQGYDNWEDVIAVGAIYEVGDPIYSDYTDAKAYYNACMDALKTRVVSEAKQAFTKQKVSLISDFEKLHSALVSSANSMVSNLSAENQREFNIDFNFFMVMCDALRDNSLSFVFSKYVMHFVVSEVNAKRMTFAKAADYILSVYLLDPTNGKVKENLSALFERLVREDDAESKTAVNGVLNRVRQVDQVLYTKFISDKAEAELEADLDDIAKRVKDGSLQKNRALQRVFELYRIHPNNALVCQVLAVLCDVCIMEYIIANVTGRSSVESTLDVLKANRSNEFKKHRSVFKQRFDSIWSQLPMESKYLIERGYGMSPGSYLNENGLALKKGLEYMKSLGEFTAPSRLGIFF